MPGVVPLRTRNQFVVKAHSTERTHVIPLYVHARECDLAYFHEQQRKGADFVQLLLTLLDGDAAFQAFVHELDNVRAIDELIKTKSSTLFHITALADVVQVQWQLQDHTHRLVNILQHSQRRREENFVRKAAVKDAAEATEEYVGGMLRPLPVRKAAVTVWIYPPHVVIPPTGDRVPENPSCVTDFFHADNAA